MNQSARVQLFILGAPRCGTTSLHAYLDRHPDICMSQPKEPCFFELEAFYRRGADWYWQHYFAHHQQELVAGEARSLHLFLPWVPARIKNYNPEARLVALLRNPVERALSARRRSAGNSKLPKLSQQIAEEKAVLKNGELFTEADLADLHAAPNKSSKRGFPHALLALGDYEPQLRRYIELFGEDRLRIVLFDEFILEPERVIEDILKFLGLNTDNYPDSNNFEPLNTAHLNFSQKTENSAFEEEESPYVLDQLKEHFYPKIASLETLLGKKTGWVDK